ncbi:hypothetical protein AAON49_01615 [Pseudotenacibaculum sp. MALMAid0570]|uniref:hypothetical protein n=1 Tax=Pseudotenacibaculum sp. MALMAid0570 TaxID=3143938 RepID=UPI0032DF615D
MKTIFKFLVITALVCVTSLTHAQKSQQQGVSIGMDLQPILQIDMSAPEIINFIFDKKSKYYKGITHNAATVIKVTSTVKWDLYAVGRSKGKSPNGKTFWDQEESFGSTVNSIADIPMSMVELRQRQINNGTANNTATYPDYSQDFVDAFRPSAANSLYVSNNGTPTPPNKLGKYIAGHSGISDDIINGYMPAGSYVSDNGIGTNFEFIMDYRILPGFPAIFPNAFSADATVAENIVSSANASSILVGGAAGNGNSAYAEPGVYTMNVQYVLLEDQ